MTYDEAVKVIRQGPGTGNPARRKSWDDPEACIWWNGQQIEHSRFKSRGVGWTLTAEDKKATDWIAYSEDFDEAKAARRLVMTDDQEEIKRLEKALHFTRDEIVNRFIEDPPWASSTPELVGGKGSPEERLAALRNAHPGWAAEGA